MTVSDLLAIVEAGRARRAPRDPNEQRWYERLRAGDFAGAGVYSVAVERQSGMPNHIRGAPFSWVAATSAYEALQAPAAEYAWIRGRAAEAFLDGYELGRGVGRVPDGAVGRALGSDAAAKAWLNRARSALTEVTRGVLGEVFRTLLPSWKAGLPESARSEITDPVFSAAFAMGILAVVQEHKLQHALLDPLVAATKKKHGTPIAGGASVAMDEALLTAIMAEPRNDEPRLVLADWLSERNDPRGEFIHLQCRLGRTLTGTRLASFGSSKTAGALGSLESVEEMKNREKALLSKFGGAWGLAETPSLTGRAWTRGFVESGTARVAEFLAALPTLARTPLIELGLVGIRAVDVAPFSEAPPHPTLETVRFSASRHGRGHAKIFRAPFFRPLRRLSLAGTPGASAPDALEALAAGADSLVSLDLSLCGMTDDSVAALADTRLFSRLEELSLEDEGLTLAMIPLLARASSLEHLSLHAALMGDAAAMALIEHAPPSLQRVNYDRWSLRPATKVALARRFSRSLLRAEIER